MFSRALFLLFRQSIGEIPQISQSKTLIQKGLGPSTQQSANQKLSYIKVLVHFTNREVIFGFTTQNFID